jgi:hypothetical protein
MEALQNQSASFVIALTMTNGQKFALKTTGKFSVFRPTTAKAPGTSYQPDGTPTAQVLNGWLRLGDKSRHKDMSFSHTIDPGAFSGHAAYTQLINGDSNCVVSPPIHNFNPNQNKTWSDQLTGMGVFSRGESNVVANAITTMEFWDAPGIQLSDNGTAYEDLKFSTYLMFKPDGDGSIYVPLRLITWELHDETLNGSTANTYTEIGTTRKLTGITPPDAETILFPHWDDVHIGQ